jgi:TPR repeat protein
MKAAHRAAVVLFSLVTMQSVDAADIDNARVAYSKGEYAVAHDRLLAAARKGDADAQELLGMMHMVGPEVFPGVPQDLTQSAVLLQRAARSGRPVARAMYCALVRRGTLLVARNVHCFEDPAMAGMVAPR